MKSHLCDCYLLRRMKGKLTRESLGLESLQVETAFGIKQEELRGKGECTLPLMLKTGLTTVHGFIEALLKPLAVQTLKLLYGTGLLSLIKSLC